MKKILVPTLIASAIASLAAVPSLAQAQESTLSYNIGVVSDYRYRGLSQTRFGPALQGGVDYADKSGFYVGAWASTIRWIKDLGAGSTDVKGPVELDLYGGYKGTAGAINYDVGFLRYEYVGNTLEKTNFYKNANTNEVYGAITVGAFTAKYSHALSNLFGNPGSKDSYYIDLNATFDMGNGWTFVPHVGYQKLTGALNVDGSYTDYSLTLAKDMGKGLSLTAAVVGSDASKNFYYPPNKQGVESLGKAGVVIGAKYTF